MPSETDGAGAARSRAVRAEPSLPGAHGTRSLVDPRQSPLPVGAAAIWTRWWIDVSHVLALTPEERAHFVALARAARRGAARSQPAARVRARQRRGDPDPRPPDGGRRARRAGARRSAVRLRGDVRPVERRPRRPCSRPGSSRRWSSCSSCGTPAASSAACSEPFRTGCSSPRSRCSPMSTRRSATTCAASSSSAALSAQPSWCSSPRSGFLPDGRSRSGCSPPRATSFPTWASRRRC